MEISTPIIIIVVTNVVAWAVQFAALKTDTKWIKSRLKQGDKTLDQHGRILSSHRAQIAEIKGACSIRHGQQFNPIGNPDSEKENNNEE